MPPNGKATEQRHGLDIEGFRKHAHAAVDAIAAHMFEIETDQHPVLPTLEQGDIIAQMPTHPPQQGEAFDVIGTSMFDLVRSTQMNWQAGGFSGYFPANMTPESLIADMYVHAVSNPAFSWYCSPPATELEVVAMDWCARLFGLSEDRYLSTSGRGGGVIQTSASDSCLVACIAARARAQALHPVLHPDQSSKPDLVILGTTQTHSLGAKAGLILDVPFVAIETRAEDDWALTGAALEEVLQRETAAGRTPFCLIATLGSTSSGAIDRLAELTAVAKRWPMLYIHLDAAWAGVFLALPEARQAANLDALNASGEPIKHPQTGETIGEAGAVHSFCTNLHKQGLVTFDASCFWMSDRRVLTEAMDLTPPFLRHTHTGKDVVPEYRNWQLSLGRRFRSLKVLFVLRSYGIEGFQAHLRRSIELAEHFAELVNTDDRFELVTPPQWSLVVFKLKGDNALNERMHAELLKDKSTYMTQTKLGEMFCVRMATGGVNTREHHMDHAWAGIQTAADAALSDRGSKTGPVTEMPAIDDVPAAPETATVSA